MRVDQFVDEEFAGPCALPSFLECWRDPPKVEPFVASLANRLLATVFDPAEILRICAAEHGVGDLPAIVSGAPPSLATLLNAGDPAILNSLKAVPAEVASAAAEILAVVPPAFDLIAAAFSKLANDEKPLRSRVAGALALAKGSPDSGFSREEIEAVDMRPPAIAAHILAASTRSARRLSSDYAPFYFECPTAYGRVVLAGGGHRGHRLEGALLIIDVGRRNVYAGGEHGRDPVQIVIDGGASTFADLAPTVFGISQIFSLGGGSEFRGRAGAAAFGVSLVHCRKGGNAFRGGYLCQASAACGIAAVACEEGNNSYYCLSYGQAYAGVRGVAFLVDSDGGCRYHANDEWLHRPAAQTPKDHNLSLAQGAASGIRDGEREGTPQCCPFAGGLALLVNGGSHNSFSCGVFGQGAAFWFSFGAIVVKGPGNYFRGVWYTQAACAHFSVACLLDPGGHSHYRAVLDQNQAAAVEGSIAWFHCAGDGSTFEGNTGRLAIAIENALAVFIADRGDNHYIRNQVPDRAFGHGCLDHSKRPEPGAAYFMDGGNPNIAPPDPRFHPDTAGWNQPPGQADLQVGGFVFGKPTLWPDGWPKWLRNQTGAI